MPKLQHVVLHYRKVVSKGEGSWLYFFLTWKQRKLVFSLPSSSYALRMLMGLLIFRVDLPIQMNLIKTIPHRLGQLLN